MTRTQGVWPEVEQGLAKAGVETISIWSDPMDDCALYMHLGRTWCLMEMGVGVCWSQGFCLAIMGIYGVLELF
jgi:hypothetical protein